MAKIGRKKGAPKGKSKANTSTVQDDVEGFLASKRMDQLADYVSRGQAFKQLSDDELSDRWLMAFKAMADAPSDEGKRARKEDFDSEFHLRKIEPPYDRVQEHCERLFAAADAALKAMDPDEFSEANRNLQHDIDNFKTRRDKSKS
jgi:hypothetical protein